ncbi:MAG: I78 family peptidase inhibitor [Gemmobacter sp.]|nr:I78 family peptidase inhibitor [Gemmobacter sp.]
MRPVTLFGGLLVPTILMACTMTDPVTPPNPADLCGASTLQTLIGGPVSAYDAKTAKGAVRIIPPGTAVTMDFSPDRLNIETDAKGVVTRVTCG